jgi:hypothetical protein
MATRVRKSKAVGNPLTFFRTPRWLRVRIANAARKDGVDLSTWWRSAGLAYLNRRRESQ